MTLCIAAECTKYRAKHPREPMVILSSDQQVDAGSAGAETGFKVERLADNWIALVAGTLHVAHELTTHYRKNLSTSADEITIDNALDRLYTPLNALRYDLADRYTQRRLAMPYADFLASARQRIPEFLHQEVSGEIGRQQIEAEVILVGRIGDAFAIYKVDGYNLEISQWENFAVIGSGATIAMGNLYQRQHAKWLPFEQTLYTVYESQRLGQIAPGVGKKTVMLVLQMHGTQVEHSLLMPRIVGDLEPLFKSYGPRDINDSIALPASVEGAIADKHQS